MYIAEFFTALIVGLVVFTVFALILDRPGPWARGRGLGGFFWFFLIVFLGAWAVGAWSQPIGPVTYGVSWVPFLFGAFAFALLIGALSEPRAQPASAVEPVEDAAAAALGMFFWLLVLVLGTAVIFAAFV